MKKVAYYKGCLASLSAKELDFATQALAPKVGLELIRKAIEVALANARELAEMVEKSNREAFEVIQRRVAEGLQEIRTSISGGKGAA